MREIVDNNQDELHSSINVTNETLVDEIMLLMGYNKKRIRGIHRIYGQDIDWAVQIGDNKRFVIDTVAYGTPISDDDVQFVVNYCHDNEYPFGFITDGDKLIIVSGDLNDEQPILKSQVLGDPDTAQKLLEFYGYKSYDSTKITEYYMQFQFTLDKLKQCLAEDGARQALYETAEQYANCKPSERNRGIIKKYIDEALDGKVDTQNTGDESLDFDISEAEKQLQAEKSELEHKVQELQTMLTDAKSKIDLDATNRSEMQADLDEKVKQLENLNSVLDDLHKRLQATEEERDSLEKARDELSEKCKTLETDAESMQESYNQLSEKCAQYQAEINSLKSEYASKVESLSEEQVDETQETEEQSGKKDLINFNESEACCDDEKVEVEVLKEEHRAELDAIKADYEQRLQDLEDKLQSTKAELQATQEALESVAKESVTRDDIQDAASSGVKVQAGRLVVDDGLDVETLKEKLQAAKVEIDRLNQACEGSKETILRLTEEKVDLKNEIDRLNEKLNSSETEDTEGTEDTKAVENESETVEQTGLTLDKGNDTVEDQSSLIAEKDEYIAKLETELAETKQKLLAVQTELNALRDSYTMKTDDLKIEIGGDNAELMKSLLAENSQLKQQIKLMSDSGNISQQANAFAIEVEKYRTQISDLHNQLSKVQVELNQKNLKIEDLKDQLVAKGSKEQVQNMELLDSIEDDPEQERTYVAAIDGNLYQERDIRRFVGICIEELYKTAAVTLMPILYDSNNFIVKEVRDNGDCDFTLGTKRFALDIQNDTEDSIMAKVVQLFKAYPERVFYCKKIGTLEADFHDLYSTHNTVADTEEVMDDTQVIANHTDEIENRAGEIVDVSDEIQNNNNSGNEVIVGEDTENSETSYDDGAYGTERVIGYAYFGIRGTEQLLTYNYASCRSLVYLYAATNNRYYKIDNEQLDTQLVTAIQQLISACPIQNIEAALKDYKNLGDFGGLLEHAQPMNKGKMKLPMTRLVINHLDQIADMVKILTEVADIFGYSEEDITLMYEISYYETDPAIQGCLADANIETLSNIDFDDSQEDEFIEKRIDGGIVDCTILSRNSLEIQSKLFRGLTRVITDDMNDEIVEDSQFENAISKMLNKAVANRRVIDPKVIGPVVGTNRQILSTNKNDVTDRYVQVKAGNQIYYVQRLDPVSQIYAFIRLQQVLFGNKQIVFHVNISKNALDFYRDQFITSNPSLDIVVKTVVAYIETRM